jgi:hypothetical protein
VTRLKWGKIESRIFSAGLDRGVFYPQNGTGVPWNGLISVEEKSSDSDAISSYYDGNKFFSRRNPGSFEATIEAFAYPLEFSEYDRARDWIKGQFRNTFGLSYRTLLGDAENGLDSGYLIHLVYNARAKSSTRDNRSISDSLEPDVFNWDISTTPLKVADTFGSHLIINSKLAYPEAIEKLEAQLYGSSSNDAYLPDPNDIWQTFEDASILTITDNGDGTWTAEGPDEAFDIIDDYFEITWPSAIWINSEKYIVSSL